MEPDMQFEITNRFSGAVQFTAEIECDESASRSVKIGLAVRWAIKSRAYLSGADLAGAYLSGMNLSGADLSGAELSGAYLCGAYLSGANLSRAYLSDADLSGADLSGADLSDADLSGVNLSGVNLSGADLSDANLAGANLSGADLSGADLSGAYLSGTDLAGAVGFAGLLIDGGLRSDGYRFLMTRTEPGPWRVKAGCRNLTIEEARYHWAATRAATPLGEETLAMIDHMIRLATIREWPAEGKVDA